MELSRLEAAMSDPEQAEAALQRYGALQQEFERQGGYTYETRIRQTLTGLGFDADDYQRPIPQLSGGQRTRAVLARLLLSDPDLLILDEPTNHLDIQAVEWLEGYLSQWDGAALIVSHDRYFLDRVVDHIWEMDKTGIELYRGNYSAYVQQRQERWELRQQIFEAEKERLLKEMDYVKRNISGQNTIQAKGRLRRLSRIVEAIENLGFEAVQGKSWAKIVGDADVSTHTMNVEEVERRIRSLRGPSHRPPRLHLNLKASLRSGDLVLRTYDVDIGYADEGRPLFHVPDLVFKRGECAALIGPNGAGKTTFLKTILGTLPPLAGEVLLGASLDIAYFAQAHEGLEAENTLVQEIETVAPNMLLADIRDLPGALPVQRRRCVPQSRDPVRRRARPAGASQAQPDQRQPAAAGRADQPPGHPLAGDPAGGAGRLPGHHPAGLARPLPDRRHRHADLGDRAGRGEHARLPGHLQPVPRLAGGATRAAEEPAPAG